MKKIIFASVLIIFLITLLSISFLLPIRSDARQGCCSHHSGVCGCQCCDGTSLSATCAPYYPQCNREIQTAKEWLAENNIPSVSINSDKQDYGLIWWGLGIVCVGGAWYYFKNK